MNEKLGRSIARAKGFNIIGILGILYNASQLDLIDLSQALTNLQKTTFFVSPNLLQQLLKKDRQNK